MWPFTSKKAAPEPQPAAPDAAVVRVPAKVPAKHETFADRLDWLCKQHNATYEIDRSTPTTVKVRVKLDGGDTVLSGKGPTTAAAVTEVCKKLEAL